MKTCRENKPEKEKEYEKEKMKFDIQAKRAIITSDEKIEAKVVRQSLNPLFGKASEDKIFEDKNTYINVGKSLISLNVSFVMHTVGPWNLKLFVASEEIF